MCESSSIHESDVGRLYPFVVYYLYQKCNSYFTSIKRDALSPSLPPPNYARSKLRSLYARLSSSSDYNIPLTRNANARVALESDLHSNARRVALRLRTALRMLASHEIIPLMRMNRDLAKIVIPYERDGRLTSSYKNYDDYAEVVVSFPFLCGGSFAAAKCNFLRVV